MQASQIDLVPFTSAELPAAAALSKAARWPHRVEDWALALSLGTGVVAMQDGRVVGTTVLATYGGTAATVSGVIVDAAMRGRGLGRRLLDWAVAAAGERTCRLVATPDGLPLYERVGFRAVGEVCQHQGVLGRGPEAPPGVRWAEADEVGRCAGQDAAAYGADRSNLVAALFGGGRVAVLENGGGFAAIRRFGRGEVVGPVVARDPAGAEVLLDWLFAGNAGVFVRTDTASPALSAFLAVRGLPGVDVGTPMVRGAEPPRDPEWTSFALASQALG